MNINYFLLNRNEYNHMGKKQISASIMCIDNLLNIEKSIFEIESTEINMLHLDAMDGHFVNNITFGPDIMNAIHNCTNLPCDYHLMLENPLPYIKRLDLRSKDIVTIHAEIKDEYLFETLDYLETLNKRGIKIGIAINPETSIESLVERDILSHIDMILIMMIKPGFAGQPIIPGIMNKPPYIRKYLDGLGYDNIMISVDGGVSLERAKELSKNGVDVFVGGTSGLFIKNEKLTKSAETLFNIINN